MEDKYLEAGQKVKLIVSDVDGTLLTSDRRLSDENIAGIKKAKEQNIKFTISTGRVVSMLDYYIKTLEITTPVIAFNGAVAWDPVSKETIYDIPMDKEELYELLDLCKYYELDYGVMTMGVNYFSPNSFRIKRYQGYNEFAKSHGMSIMEVDVFDEKHSCIDGVKVYKLLITEKDSKKIKVMVDHLQSMKTTGYTFSEPTLLDISEKSADKGFGVKRLAQYYGLKPEEVCAIGDYDNDISMLSYAGFSVAMGNAQPNVKEHAFYVTETNDDNGLAQVLNKYILR
ncbi:MAG TPA: HAD family phosphatase [Clostridiales bacterium]|nr:HAD family phosphatase [Clostridiales bacterium]